MRLITCFYGAGSSGEGEGNKGSRMNTGYWMKIYHGQILTLLKSIEAKTLAGRVFKNSEKIKRGWLLKAEDILLKMIDIDESSLLVEDARKKLYEKKEQFK